MWVEYLAFKKKSIENEKAKEIIEKLNLDFSDVNLSSDFILEILSRKEIINQIISSFLEKKLDGIVINLGCGLSTCCEKFKEKSSIWFDIDLPDVINLKKKFFSESKKYRLIANSIFDYSWIDIIPKNKNTIFIIEGILPYFKEDQVKELLLKIVLFFPSSEIIIHAISKWSLIYRKLTGITKDLHWAISNENNIIKLVPSLELIDKYFIYDFNCNKMSKIRKVLKIFSFYNNQNMLIHLKNHQM